MYNEAIDKVIQLHDSYDDGNDDWKIISYSNESGVCGPKVLHGKSRIKNYYIRGVSAKIVKKLSPTIRNGEKNVR